MADALGDASQLLVLDTLTTCLARRRHLTSIFTDIKPKPIIREPLEERPEHIQSALSPCFIKIPPPYPLYSREAVCLSRSNPIERRPPLHLTSPIHCLALPLRLSKPRPSHTSWLTDYAHCFVTLLCPRRRAERWLRKPSFRQHKLLPVATTTYIRQVRVRKL